MMKAGSVLIIDDEKDICLLLSALLKNIGYKVKTAYSLQEGSEKIKNYDIDVAFLDIKLPDGEGFSIIDDLRKVNKDVKIILISAFSDNDINKKAEDHGVDYFIHKPFNKDDIKKALVKTRMLE